MPAPNERSEELLQEVVALATTDLEFRAALLADPAGAIHARFGVRVPQGLRLRFLEKPKDIDVLVVLPDPSRPGGELDEDDLDMVAGGTQGCTNTTTAW